MRIYISEQRISCVLECRDTPSSHCVAWYIRPFIIEVKVASVLASYMIRDVNRDGYRDQLFKEFLHLHYYRSFSGNVLRVPSSEIGSPALAGLR